MRLRTVWCIYEEASILWSRESKKVCSLAVAVMYDENTVQGQCLLEVLDMLVACSAYLSRSSSNIFRNLASDITFLLV